MANNKTAVRQILDKVKAEGRTSLTAPEGKLVCDAYGISVPKEGVATSAAEATKLASGIGFLVQRIRGCLVRRRPRRASRSRRPG